MKINILNAFAGAIVALLALTSVSDAQQEGVYTIPHYKFETGQEMDNVKIAYVTYGKLNADKSNAVLLVPGTSSGRHWADDYVGPGKMYDSDKYFFIGVDAVGGGNSTQPKDGLGIDFPRYTTTRHRAYRISPGARGAGIERAARGGWSVDGFVPGCRVGHQLPNLYEGHCHDRARRAHDQHFHSIVDAVIGLITLDPAYKDGKYTENPLEGIKRSGMIYFPWLFSDEYLAKHI